MDEYLTLLVLAYFRQKKEYSVLELAQTLGISMERIIEIIDASIEREDLAYLENRLQLTVLGRLRLQNQCMDFYSFNSGVLEIPRVDMKKAWGLDRIYIPNGFLEKI